jgi:hypothetical protein
MNALRFTTAKVAPRALRLGQTKLNAPVSKYLETVPIPLEFVAMVLLVCLAQSPVAVYGIRPRHSRFAAARVAHGQ